MGISWRSVVGFFSAISSCCKQPSGSTSTPKSSDPVPSGSQQNVVVGDSTELPKITEPTQLNRFIEYIEDLLAALKKKPSDQTAAATSNVGAEFGGHLKCAADMMERVSSEAEKFKDSKGDLIPEEARKIVTDALKGLGNLHWIGVAFSIVAYLLENVHRISSNSEECIELLEKIIDVAKVLRELGEKTCDDQTQEALMKAVQTIVDGAIICCYYMQERPLFKYLTAQTVEGSLRNIRDKLHDLKSDLTLMVGRLNLMATEQIQKQLPQRSEQRRNILQISDPATSNSQTVGVGVEPRWSSPPKLVETYKQFDKFTEVNPSRIGHSGVSGTICVSGDSEKVGIELLYRIERATPRVWAIGFSDGSNSVVLFPVEKIIK